MQGGQHCDYCQANTTSSHPAENMVDGGSAWWQSPPLSRGMKYNFVNITIDLEQVSHGSARRAHLLFIAVAVPGERAAVASPLHFSYINNRQSRTEIRANTSE